MKYDIRYKPAFATLFITLDPGDRLIAQAGAMASMGGGLSMETEFAGGFLAACLRKFLGGETLFVNRFTNRTRESLTLVLTQSLVGDMASITLRGDSICFQPGAYIAHTGTIQTGVHWAGLSSWLAGEGLFKLKLSGNGTVFFGAYGGIHPQKISPEGLVVDSGHLVAYQPSVRMKIGLASGLLGSVTSGEGLVNRLSGEGTVYLQSRSMGGLVRFLKSKV
ncbi:MAG: TIGR00266 family protein [Thermosynechococcaceae cyanobacterium]